MIKKLALILCASFLLAGCDISYIGFGVQGDGDVDGGAGQNTTLVSNYASRFGSGLNLSMRNPKTMNPLRNNDATVDRVLKLLFEPLCEIKENMRPTPNLLSKVDFASDGLSAYCTIREDVYWSDGVKMSAGDVKFSVDAIQGSNGSLLYQDTVAEITAIEVVDNSNFRVRFSVPQGGTPYALCFPAIPRHYYEGEMGDGSYTALAPVGNGIYKVSGIKNIREINFESNENSFKNKPYIESVKVLIIDDSMTDLQAFDQNIIDAIDSDSLAFGKYSGSKDISATAYDTNNFVFLGFHSGNPIFEDPLVRQAIAHCIDKNAIVESIYLNNAKTALSVVNPVSYLYEPDLTDYAFNMDQARNLLFQAGFRDSDLDGVLDREVGGVTMKLQFRLLVNEENDERMKIAQSIKENMELLSLLVEIDACDFETYMEKLASGDFDLYMGTMNFDTRPDFKFFLHSGSTGEGGFNYFRYASEELDEYLLNAESARSESELRSALSDIQKYVAQELPCVGIAFVQRALLTDPGIKGDKRPVINNIFFNVEQWKIE